MTEGKTSQNEKFPRFPTFFFCPQVSLLENPEQMHFNFTDTTVLLIAWGQHLQLISDLRLIGESRVESDIWRADR
jgi:hypothetical protein